MYRFEPEFGEGCEKKLIYHTRQIPKKNKIHMMVPIIIGYIYL